MRACWCWMLLTTAMAADPMIGDQVRVLTDDGRDLVGTLLSSSEADPLRLRVNHNGMRADVVIPASQVLVSSEELSRDQQRLQAIASESRRLGEASSAEQHWHWARECRDLGDRIAWRQHLRAVLVRDPDHESANRALGHVRHEGQWMPVADAMRAMGFERYDGAWMTPEQIAEREAALAAQREAAEAARLARLERAAERRALQASYRPQTSIMIGSGWVYPRWPLVIGCGPSLPIHPGWGFPCRPPGFGGIPPVGGGYRPGFP